MRLLFTLLNITLMFTVYLLNKKKIVLLIRPQPVHWILTSLGLYKKDNPIVTVAFVPFNKYVKTHDHIHLEIFLNNGVEE